MKVKILPTDKLTFFLSLYHRFVGVLTFYSKKKINNPERIIIRLVICFDFSKTYIITSDCTKN